MLTTRWLYASGPVSQGEVNRAGLISLFAVGYEAVVQFAETDHPSFFARLVTASRRKTSCGVFR